MISPSPLQIPVSSTPSSLPLTASLLNQHKGETTTSMKNVSPFQTKVYHALRHIPEGKVTTYKELGRFIDCPSSQAVGQALKRNPFAPSVPCHRVVKTDLSVGGYLGTSKVESKSCQTKRSLLSQEGVVMEQSANGEWKVDPTCLFSFLEVEKDEFF